MSVKFLMFDPCRCSCGSRTRQTSRAAPSPQAAAHRARASSLSMSHSTEQRCLLGAPPCLQCQQLPTHRSRDSCEVWRGLLLMRGLPLVGLPRAAGGGVMSLQVCVARRRANPSSGRKAAVRALFSAAPCPAWPAELAAAGASRSSMCGNGCGQSGTWADAGTACQDDQHAWICHGPRR